MKKEVERSNIGIQAAKTSFLVNIGLTLMKLSGGLLGGSSALVADGFHSLSDLGSDIGVFMGFKKSRKPSDRTHNYGHGKYETFVSFMIGMILIGISLGIAVKCATDFYILSRGSEFTRPGWITLAIALLSIGIKESLYQYNIRKAEQINSSLLKANAWHHRTDSLSSMAAVLGIGGALLLGGSWVILDPIAGLVVSIIILAAAVKILKECIPQLLEKSLNSSTNSEIMKIIIATKGVKDAHKLRTRRIGDEIALDVHILVMGELSVRRGHAIANRVENRLKTKFRNKLLLSIHIEPFEEKSSLQGCRI